MENIINLWTDGGFRSSTNVSGWAWVGYVEGEDDANLSVKMEQKKVVQINKWR